MCPWLRNKPEVSFFFIMSMRTSYEQTNVTVYLYWQTFCGYATSIMVMEACVRYDMLLFVVYTGDKKRRDVVYALMSSPQIDIYVSASQKGAVAVWNSKVSLLRVHKLEFSCKVLTFICRISAHETA